MVPCPQCGAPNPSHAPACSFCGFVPKRPPQIHGVAPQSCGARST